MIKRIKRCELNGFLTKISKKRRLFVPKRSDSGMEFAPFSDGTEVCLSGKTDRSPKDFFFPQVENLMEFKRVGDDLQILDLSEECEDFVIFGVRGCDVKSFEILDRVFLSEPVDLYYQNRRKHAIIISTACQKPCETCFCTAFGIKAFEPSGDIECFFSEDYIYLCGKTKKGEALLSDLEDYQGDEVTKIKEEIKKRLDRLPLKNVSTASFGADKTDELFDLPVWDELSKTCVACGSCTFFCPTCHCYDIKDKDTGHEIKRFRCWDSCMYSDFTKMSAGQPRTSQKERLRQRMMHKLVYFPKNNDGMFSCVGCGRCLEKCPVGMNIVKAMKKIGGEIGE